MSLLKPYLWQFKVIKFIRSDTLVKGAQYTTLEPRIHQQSKLHLYHLCNIDRVISTLPFSAFSMGKNSIYEEDDLMS